jgi:hypothetical protein
MTATHGGGPDQNKWLSTKNLFTRRSTPRHPIDMSSTAKPPYPMPCTLDVILLPESRVHGCHMQKTLFPGTYWVHTGECVLGQFLRAGCAGATWVRRGSLGSGMCAGRRCLSPLVGGVRWTGPPCNGADTCGLCAGGRVGGWSTWCLPAVRGLSCVGAWAGAASGGFFWAFWAGLHLGHARVGGGYSAERFLTMRTLRVSRS